jgi:hypothetical protein
MMVCLRFGWFLIVFWFSRQMKRVQPPPQPSRHPDKTTL